MLKMEEQMTAVRERERSKPTETRGWLRRKEFEKKEKNLEGFPAKVMAEKDVGKASQRTSRARQFVSHGPVRQVLALMFSREENASHKSRGSTNVGSVLVQDIKKRIVLASDLVRCEVSCKSACRAECLGCFDLLGVLVAVKL